jgi:hypothetical protein
LADIEERDDGFEELERSYVETPIGVYSKARRYCNYPDEYLATRTPFMTQEIFGTDSKSTLDDPGYAAWAKKRGRYDVLRAKSLPLHQQQRPIKDR